MALLTAASFLLAANHLIFWGPSIPVALIVLAIAQMGVHLVFFLHITTGPDNTNNVLALSFSIPIVVLVVGGSIWIMSHLNERTMAPPTMSQVVPMVMKAPLRRLRRAAGLLIALRVAQPPSAFKSGSVFAPGR